MNVIPKNHRKLEIKGPQGTYDLRRELQRELVKRCEEQPRYSLRAFAESLYLDVSTLSKIMSGKRPIGRNLSKKLVQRLALLPSKNHTFVSRAKSAYENIAEDSFRVIADWYHYALLELMRLDTYKSNPRWMASALGISVAEVKAALERLERLELIEKDGRGDWIDVSGGKSTTVGNEFSSAAFRRLQKQILQQAMHALENVPIEKRDQSAMTMAIDKELLPEAKVRLRDFRRDFAQFLSRGNKRNEIYQLSLSLFPVTSLKGSLE